MRPAPLLAFLLLLVLLLGTACSASTEIGEFDADGTTTDASDADGDVDTDARGPQLSSEAVFASIENSVVFVQAPDRLSSGSGIVLEGGWILTNAHVVDRHPSVRVGRGDGEDLGLHDVHSIDWVFDLALIGPVTDPSLTPISRGVSSELSIGSRVLLAGFPDENSALPTPTLTEGIVSRRRSVSLGDFPFLQVDAKIAAGQSGGALVNGWGELVGISGLVFGGGDFGLVFASEPLWPRVDDLIATPGPALPNGPAQFELNEQAGPLRNISFTLEVEEGGSIDMSVTSPADVWVDVQTLGGITVNGAQAADPLRGLPAGALFIDEVFEGGEDVIARVEPGTYQVVIGAYSQEIVDVEVLALNEMRTFSDVEELQTLPTNQIVEGDFDWVRDTDTWELPLQAGQEVVITADGISDPVLVVRLDDVVIGTSDDEGLGLFGKGAQVSFVAEETATYRVEIGMLDRDARWGYLLEASVN